MSSDDNDCVVISVGEPRTTCDCGCKKPIEAGPFHESVRLKSFPKEWPYPVSREELARYGFKYIGPDDRVECWKCKVQISNWDYHDLAGVEHKYWNPKCPLLNRKAWWGFKIMPECFVQPETMPGKCFMLTEEPLDVDDEKWYQIKMEEEYSKEKKRLASYDNVLWRYPVGKEDLAKYGFYYIGGKDTVKCHFCGLLVNGWQLYDLAFSEHLRLSPDCPLLRRLATNSNVTIQEAEKLENAYREEIRKLMCDMKELPYVCQTAAGFYENQMMWIDPYTEEIEKLEQQKEEEDALGQDLCGTSPRTARRLDMVNSSSSRAKLISGDILCAPLPKKSRVE
ncbi:hypothetical protein B566_EDAN017371 [Ephemera danica]|nr:hypothetical protein B566_EDAN017371 [Ephemera danica]